MKDEKIDLLNVTFNTFKFYDNEFIVKSTYTSPK